MIKPGPVYLRLCTDELKIVSLDWWDRFLRSQEKAVGIVNNGLTEYQYKGVESRSLEGNGTHGPLEPVQKGRTSGGRQEPVEVRSGLTS
jgi:hypothetical protein